MDSSSVTFEVKVDGTKVGKSRRSIQNMTYEPVWLNWDEFKIVPTKDVNRFLVTNGRQAFQILKGKAREKYLEEHDVEGKE